MRALLIAGLLAQASVGLAQQATVPFTYHEERFIAGPLDQKPHPARNEIDRALDALRVRSYDPNANVILKASEAFIRSGGFHLPSLRFLRARTFRNDEGDGLIAEWSFNEPWGRGTVIDWDTPVTTNFYFRFSPALMSREQLEEAFSGLFAGPVPQPVQLFMTGTTISRIYAFESGSPLQIARASSAYLLEGTNEGGTTLLKYAIPKVVASRLYDIPQFIPERFPSLKIQAKKWTESRLLAGLEQSGARTEFLIAELVSRTPTPEVFRRIIVASDPWTVSEGFRRGGIEFNFTARLPVIIDAWENAEKPKEQAFMDYIFYGLRAEGACTPQTEANILRLYKARRLRVGGAVYLRKCSQSPEVLQMLRDDPPPKGDSDKRL